jgi:hypothetical protein
MPDHKSEEDMRRKLHRRLCLITGVLAAAFAAPHAQAAPPEAIGFFSGQTAFGQATVEPALDDATGNVVFILTPNGAPLPSKANPHAQDVMYIPVYPTSSTIPGAHLDCQTGAGTGTGNCNHLQVLPFSNPVYDPDPADRSGSSKACQDYNGGRPCTVYLGHDHLIGVPSTGSGFNVAWHVELVLFTPKGFRDGAIDSRITTLSDLDALVASGDAVIAPTPIVFNCSIVAQAVYDQGTPLSFPFP